MPHPLDRVIWNGLAGRHARHGEGDRMARRYLPDLLPFGAARDRSSEALAALAKLTDPGQTIVQVELSPVAAPGLVPVRTGTLVQLVLDSPALPAEKAEIVPLGPADAIDMLDLAVLTQPGPFTLRAQELGRFLGIRINGRLAAMAGERFALEGYSEVSGVCTHPDFRGRGFARALSIAVARDIARRGETPFLHAWVDNAPAIKLYESIGFVCRERFVMIAAQRQD